MIRHLELGLSKITELLASSLANATHVIRDSEGKQHIYFHTTTKIGIVTAILPAIELMN